MVFLVCLFFGAEGDDSVAFFEFQHIFFNFKRAKERMVEFLEHHKNTLRTL